GGRVIDRDVDDGDVERPQPADPRQPGQAGGHPAQAEQQVGTSASDPQLGRGGEGHPDLVPDTTLGGPRAAFVTRPERKGVNGGTGGAQGGAVPEIAVPYGDRGRRQPGERLVLAQPGAHAQPVGAGMLPVGSAALALQPP